MTYEKTLNEENESRVEIAILIKCVLEKWKMIVASGLICALVGILFATLTYVPRYTATISYVVNSKNTTDTELTERTFIVAEYLANTYDYLIKSRDFINNVKIEAGLTENITGYISSSLIENSNIMKVVVRTDDAKKSYNIARAISIYLPEKAKATVRSGSLEALEEPVEPIVPDSNNNLIKMGLIGLLAGIALCGAVVVVLQLLKNAVMTPNDLTNKIDVTHIGSVPHVDVNKKKGKKDAKHEPVLVTNKKTGFVFSETYKSMRTKIERFSKKNNAKAILITSALENEGKTTVAANVAIALAQNGNSVLLMDCDLRKPAVATVMDLKGKVRVAAIDVIKGNADVDSAIIKADGKLNLDIIGGDKAVGNSSEILSTQGFKKVLDYLREKYDYILVDTPPSQLFTDAAIISEFTDAAMVVVKQNGANIDDIIGVINDVSQSKAELIGFVFNNVSDASILPGGYSKKYNYSYYGYGRNE